MPLEILAPMVVLGIGFVVGLVQFLGLSQRRKFLSPSDAYDRFKRDFPHCAGPVLICLTQNKSAAFIAFEDDRAIGLVQANGAHCFTRTLMPGDITHQTQCSSNGLRIRFAEFTHSQDQYDFADSQDRDKVASMISNLIIA